MENPALALALVLFATPALAGPTDDLIAVHAELRALEGIPAHDWPLLDGVWDCDDNAKWSRARLIERGWAAADIELWIVKDPYNGGRHAIACGNGLCIDGRESMLAPLSAYDEPWRWE